MSFSMSSVVASKLSAAAEEAKKVSASTSGGDVAPRWQLVKLAIKNKKGAEFPSYVLSMAQGQENRLSDAEKAALLAPFNCRPDGTARKNFNSTWIKDIPEGLKGRTFYWLGPVGDAALDKAVYAAIKAAFAAPAAAPVKETKAPAKKEEVKVAYEVVFA